MPVTSELLLYQGWFFKLAVEDCALLRDAAIYLSQFALRFTKESTADGHVSLREAKAYLSHIAPQNTADNCVSLCEALIL